MEYKLYIEKELVFNKTVVFLQPQSAIVQEAV
jgi:hypothetical protein